MTQDINRRETGKRMSRAVETPDPERKQAPARKRGGLTEPIGLTQEKTRQSDGTNPSVADRRREGDEQ